GHRGRGEHDVEVGPGQVGQAGHVLGVAGRDRDGEAVVGEGARDAVHVAPVDEPAHGDVVGRSDNVGRRALFDVGDELLAAGERERDARRIGAALEAGLHAPERARERRCRQDGDARRAAATPARRRDRRHREQQRQATPHRSGTSTTTLVAFTAATARTPGAKPSSSAASRDISDTTRCGPAWSSTWAITLSLTTRVTMPGKGLRADWPTMARAPGA